MSEKRLGDALSCACGGRTRVIRSVVDASGQAIMRRRECLVCQGRFSTKEIQINELTGQKQRNPSAVVKQLHRLAREIDQYADAINVTFGAGGER